MRRSTVTATEDNTKEAATGCSVIGPALLQALEQTAISAGKALATALQNVLTVANITKCLHGTGEKIEDGLQPHQPNCGDPNTQPQPGEHKAPKSDLTTPGKTPKNELSNPGQGSDNPPPSFIDYPVGFDENSQGPEWKLVHPSQEAKVVWQTVQPQTVAERWPRTSARAKSVTPH